MRDADFQRLDRPRIAPSVLSADFGRIADECRGVLDAGADWLHVDVMDGHFVPNLTMGLDMIRGLRRHLPDAVLDVHLMVTNPQAYVTSYAEAGADIFTFHAELIGPAAEGGLNGGVLVDDIHAAGMRAGLVVNPPTPVEAMEPLLDCIDLALVMSVNPGRSGQAFMPEVLPKATWLKQTLADRGRPDVLIEMDGGMSPETAPRAVAAGVDVMVAGSAVFGADDRAAVITSMQAAGD